jgi:Putative zinc-finger
MDTEPNSTVCSQYEILLEDSLEGPLGGPDAQRLSEHVRTCANCRVALEDAAASNRLLRLAEPTPDPGPAFTRLVMARIRTEQQSDERSLWRLVAAFARPFALSATLALGLMLAYDAYLAPSPNTESAALQSSDARELLSDPGAVPATADDTLLMVVETDHGK